MPIKNNRQNLTIGIALAFILLVTAITYYPAIYGGFVWDDSGYIVFNHLVKHLSLQGFKAAFTSFNNANYHPVTILAFAWEYFFFGLNPLPYHIVNIVVHLINCILVFSFLLLLTKNISVAFITGLLFGIHPLHVESVAWISELKDVLYTLFYLAGLLSYLTYIRSRRSKFYIYTLFLFLLSLLSKSMAMTFPLVLLLMDYYEGRKGFAQTIKEKIPFLAVSIIFGLIAIESQEHIVHLNMAYSLLQGAFIASYGLIFYLVKMLVPLNLVPLYHYPYGYGGILPLEYMLAPAAIVILASIVYRSTRYTKKIFWGAVFYLVTVFPVLQLIPVGHAKAADRYTYVPLIGIFFILSIFLVWIWDKILKKNNFFKITSLCLACLLIVSMMSLTIKQTGIWKTNKVLWEYQITKNPYSYIAYNNLGIRYHSSDMDKALYYYTTALQIKPEYSDPYTNVCNIYQLRNEKVTAVSYCLKAILNNTGATPNAYVILGDIFRPANPNLALELYEAAVFVNPGNELGYTRLCNFYYSLKEFKNALPSCIQAAHLNPGCPINYQNLGDTYRQMKEYDQAEESYFKALSLDPAFIMPHHNLALIYYYLKKYDLAIKHYKMAVSLGSTISPELQKLVAHYTEEERKGSNSHGGQ